MAELREVNLSEMFEGDFPSTAERLTNAYKDPVVHERSTGIMRAEASERLGLQAQLTTYLAAAHILFPEESQIINDSLDGTKNG
jgi:hypothetical protein